jgi:hypothetical protein
VRNWYVFSASERWRADDTEYEHYADSASKSGGQKEKLAYAILAASLAYQFKLEWGAAKSRTFRFAVIDEAFGRGSDDSTRFALELFRRLGLQLLIVTPLQKSTSFSRTFQRWASWTTRKAARRAYRPSRSRSITRAGSRMCWASRRRRTAVTCPRRPAASRPWLPDKSPCQRRPAPAISVAPPRRQLVSFHLPLTQPWDPYGTPIRGPAPREISEHLGAVQEWAAEWRRAEQGPLRIEYKKVGGRHVGSNTIPSRAWIDGYDQAWTLLGVRDDVRRLVEMGQATGATCPRLMPWLQRHPMKALRLAACWPEMLATVQCIDQCQSPGMYLRQVGVPGVDTKFIERNRGVLGELLDLQLDPERTDAGAADFESRYRFRRRPSYVRFRCEQLHGFSELSVRAEEFAARPAGVSRACVVENEITYLTIPCPDDTKVIFGGGCAVPVLEPVGWLSDLDIVYWGDIDTHGFVILDRMRQRFPCRTPVQLPSIQQCVADVCRQASQSLVTFRRRKQGETTMGGSSCHYAVDLSYSPAGLRVWPRWQDW